MGFLQRLPFKEFPFLKWNFGRDIVMSRSSCHIFVFRQNVNFHLFLRNRSLFPIISNRWKGFGSHTRVFAVSLFAAASSSTSTSSNDDEDKLRRHFDDIDEIRTLTEKTLICSNCRGRHAISDTPVEGVVYCECEKKLPKVVYGREVDGIPWTPFLERKNVIVWRREHPAQRGLYVYKMYGRFDDVSVKEFIDVQLDLSEFRRSWDTATAQCHVIEEEIVSETSLTQYYYWEVNWPQFFSNRDYVCHRTLRVRDGTVVIYTEAAEHPGYPKKPKNFRVEDYVSILTVRSLHCDSNEKGLEFSLTAFENPGLSLPSSITTWVAIRGLPEFMNNLRKACRERQNWIKTEKTVLISSSTNLLNNINQGSSSSSSSNSTKVYA